MEDNLRVSPQSINAGGAATVSVDVTNRSNSNATYFASLWVEQQISHTDEFVIGAGETRTVELPLSVDRAGEYEVRVGRESGNPWWLPLWRPHLPLLQLRHPPLFRPRRRYRPPPLRSLLRYRDPARRPHPLPPGFRFPRQRRSQLSRATISAIIQPEPTSPSIVADGALSPVIGELQFSDSSPSPDDEVTLAIPISHPGTTGEELVVEVELGGDLINRQTVTVPPGGTVRVEATVLVPTQETEITVRVADQTRRTAITPAESGNTGLIVGLVAAVAAAAVMVVIIVAVYRRRRLARA